MTKSRPIKFRAWDIETQEMITPPKCHIGVGSGSYLVLMGLDGQICLPNAYGLPDERPNQMDVIKDRFKVMQYTGLVDRMGTDIYEGDILVYCGYTYDLDDYGKPDCDYQFHKTRVTFKDGAFQVPIHKHKVIGNIYENFDLLDPIDQKILQQ